MGVLRLPEFETFGQSQTTRDSGYRRTLPIDWCELTVIEDEALGTDRDAFQTQSSLDNSVAAASLHTSL